MWINLLHFGEMWSNLHYVQTHIHCKDGKNTEPDVESWNQSGTQSFSIKFWLFFGYMHEELVLIYVAW